MKRSWVQATQRDIPYEEGSTPIPDTVYDMMGTDIEGNEIKVVMLILRHSLGEQQMYAELSVEDIHKMTFIESLSATKECLQACVDKAYFAIDDRKVWLLGEVLFTGVPDD